jgi:hypothetical protein
MSKTDLERLAEEDLRDRSDRLPIALVALSLLLLLGWLMLGH